MVRFTVQNLRSAFQQFLFITQKLETLEKEEELRERAGFYNSDSDDDPEMDEIRKTARQ